MAVEMKVKGLTMDPESGAFVVFLSDLENRYILPIWIGPFEANAIALKLSDSSAHRPITHELIGTIMKTFDAQISKIEVMDLKDNTYYALIHILADGEKLTIDSRPSDAIAVALTVGAPIFVREKVLYKSKTVEVDKAMDEDQLKEFLESLNPEDFKYKA
jgi:bifunctional DNase/RNase